jgi:ATP/ADP translocase/HEAT repeat protein
MNSGLKDFSNNDLGRQILRWINLRPGELGRTSWMFAFYIFTSIGILWFEATSSGLFLREFGAKYLPFIYLASMVISSIWSAFYTWLQRYIPLRWVVVIVAVLIGLPIPLLLSGVSLGHSMPKAIVIASLTLMQASVLGMRLWLQTIYVLNDLNTSITANQLFNVREIRRTYPLISSGVLVADVVAGLALPLLLSRLGLSTVILFAAGMILTGAGILFFLGQYYERYFPQSTLRRREAKAETSTGRISTELQRYRWLLFTFFILAEIVFLLVDFQFMGQLEEPKLLGLVMPNPGNRQTQDELIAGFIGRFQGVLGFFELTLQWALSSRLIERFGIFGIASVLPIAVLSLGGLGAFSALLPAPLYGQISRLFPLVTGQAQLQFFLMVALKFIYELFHFTLFASIAPVLFQPLPDSVRNGIQSMVRGNSEPIATGLVGGLLALALGFGLDRLLGLQWQTTLFITSITLAGLWLLTNFLIRGDYLRLWVIRSARTSFRSSALLLKEFKKDAIAALSQLKSEADLRSCIELLSKIDPDDTGVILMPMLPHLSTALQQRVLEVVVQTPNPDPQHRIIVNQILARSTWPDLTASALKYLYSTDDTANFEKLKPYFQDNIPPMIRGTAAALCLDRGDNKLKGEASNVLRLMITSSEKQEKLMGTRALTNLKFLQALQLYVPNLLNDSDLDVRLAALEVISATHFEKAYPTLVKALYSQQTRLTSTQALIQLGDEALPLMRRIVDDWRQPDAVKAACWSAIGQIASIDAIDLMISRLTLVWGDDRRNVLRALLKIADEQGIEATLDRLGRSGLEALIDQELMLIGQTSAGIIDISNAPYSDKVEMLNSALINIQADSIDRLFLLMQFLYDPYTIQAAAFNFQSGNLESMAEGLEILDNQLDIPNKRAVLALLDRNPDLDRQQKQLQEQLRRYRDRPETNPTSSERSLLNALKKITQQQQAELSKQLEAMDDILTYHPLPPHERLGQLMELRHFFSDWLIACCFYLARETRWTLSRHQVLGGIRNAKGYVREAALMYLRDLYPQAFENVLPKLRNDPDRLVQAQVKGILNEWGYTARQSMFPENDDDDMNTGILSPMG